MEVSLAKALVPALLLGLCRLTLADVVAPPEAVWLRVFRKQHGFIRLSGVLDGDRLITVRHILDDQRDNVVVLSVTHADGTPFDLSQITGFKHHRKRDLAAFTLSRSYRKFRKPSREQMFEWFFLDKRNRGKHVTPLFCGAGGAKAGITAEVPANPDWSYTSENLSAWGPSFVDHGASGGPLFLEPTDGTAPYLTAVAVGHFIVGTANLFTPLTGMSRWLASTEDVVAVQHVDAMTEVMMKAESIIPELLCRRALAKKE